MIAVRRVRRGIKNNMLINGDKNKRQEPLKRDLRNEREAEICLSCPYDTCKGNCKRFRFFAKNT